jgi:hypothetical protein
LRELFTLASPYERKSLGPFDLNDIDVGLFF